MTLRQAGRREILTMPFPSVVSTKVSFQNRLCTTSAKAAAAPKSAAVRTSSASPSASAVAETTARSTTTTAAEVAQQAEATTFMERVIDRVAPAMRLYLVLTRTNRHLIL